MLIVIESPLRSAVVLVKPTFHVARAKPICGVPAKVTALGVVAAVTVMAAAGATVAVSALVVIDQLFAAYVAAGPLVTPATVSAPDWAAVSVQPAGIVIMRSGPIVVLLVVASS